MAQLPNLTTPLGYARSIWKPILRIISSITNANPCVITTTENHGYVDGLSVSIFLPSPNFGMRELNENIYPITVLSDTTFSIPVDSTNFIPFSSVLGQSAQVLPVGDNNQLNNTFRNVTEVTPVS